MPWPAIVAIHGKNIYLIRDEKRGGYLRSFGGPRPAYSMPSPSAYSDGGYGSTATDSRHQTLQIAIAGALTRRFTDCCCHPECPCPIRIAPLTKSHDVPHVASIIRAVLNEEGMRRLRQSEGRLHGQHPGVKGVVPGRSRSALIPTARRLATHSRRRR